MKNILELLVLYLLRGLIGLINLLPIRLRLLTLKKVLQFAFALKPSLKRTSLKNLEQAFPDGSVEWREKVYQQSFDSLAQLLVDMLRLDSLDEKWVREHVLFKKRGEFDKLKAKHPVPGVLIATGHLGSFELLAFSAAIYGYPLSFVVRNFTASQIDNWWRSIREKFGNRVIDRKGAYRQIIRDLKSGRDVGILFDQNVRRNHAVFVDWFGKPAATTRALGLAALQVEAPIVVASIHQITSEKYEIDWEQCEVKDIYDNLAASREEKVRLITERATKIYEDMIRRKPEAWFWMHRRWKTRPDPRDEKKESTKLQASSGG